MYSIYAFLGLYSATAELVYDPRDRQMVDKGYIVLAASFTNCIDGAGEASFTIPPAHPLYHSLYNIKTHIMIKDDDKVVWYGRIFSIKRGFTNCKVITCEGAMAFLNDICLAPYRYYKENPNRGQPDEPDYIQDPKTKADHIDYIMDVYNSRATECRRLSFSTPTIIEFQTGLVIEGCDGYNTVLTEIKSMIGELNYHLIMSYGVSSSNVRPGISMSLGKLPLAKTLQTIEFGKNLLDFEEFINSESIYGTIIPVGNGDSNCFNDNGKDPMDSILPLKERGYYVTGNTSEYGMIDKVINFDNISNPQALTDAAEAVFQLGGGNAATEFTIKAVDLHLLDVNTDTFTVGDSVEVKSVPHNLDKEFIISEININMLQPESNSYVFRDTNMMTPETFVDQYYALKIRTDIRLDQKITAGKGYGIVCLDHDGFDLLLDMPEASSDEDTEE